MIVGDGFVVQDVGRAAVGCDYGIDSAIVVEITDCHASAHPSFLEDFA
jgi:hypothetical protein